MFVYLVEQLGHGHSCHYYDDIQKEAVLRCDIVDLYFLFLVPPHLAVGKAGAVLGFLELTGKIALVVEAAKMGYFLNGAVGDPEQHLSVVDTGIDYMLEYGLAVDFLVLPRQVVLADIELRCQLFEGEIFAEMVLDVAVHHSQLLFQSRVVLLTAVG